MKKCSRCSSLVDEPDKNCCKKCSNRRAVADKRLYIKRIKAGVCARCGKYAAQLGKLKCGECRKETNKQNHLFAFRRKVEVLTHYGKNGELKCNWRGCDVVDIDMLTIDHIYNDGAKDRRENSPRGLNFYLRLIKGEFPRGFQTLCGNHQLKKQMIHVRKIRGK